MATIYENVGGSVANRDFARWRVSWGGVWGGFLAVMGTLILLGALGLAVGVTAVNVGPSETPDAAGLGLAAGIWTGVSLLIALFVGGLVAARMSLTVDRTSAMLEGVLVWVLAVLATIYVASSGVGLLVGGASNLLGGTAKTLASAANGTDIASLFQGNPDQVLARLNDPQTVRTVAAATGKPESDVRQLFDTTRQKVQTARNNPAEVAADVRSAMGSLTASAGGRVEQAAARAQPKAATTAWVTLVVLVVTLIAVALGAWVGQREAIARVRNA